MEFSLVLILLVLTLLNSIGLIALVRQVGLLHLRNRPLPFLETDEGPEPGQILSFETRSWPVPELSSSVDRVLIGFVSPTCRICATVLPSFEAVSRTQERGEETILVVEAVQERAQEYLDSYKISLPFIAELGSLTRNRIPGTPFAVVADGRGVVLKAGGVNSLEQIELLLDAARLIGSESEEKDELAMISAELAPPDPGALEHERESRAELKGGGTVVSG